MALDTLGSLFGSPQQKEQTQYYAAPEQAVVLSPFAVNASSDTGYAATSTLAGTRVGTFNRSMGFSGKRGAWPSGSAYRITC